MSLVSIYRISNFLSWPIYLSFLVIEINFTKTFSRYLLFLRVLLDYGRYCYKVLCLKASNREALLWSHGINVSVWVSSSFLVAYIRRDYFQLTILDIGFYDATFSLVALDFPDMPLSGIYGGYQIFLNYYESPWLWRQSQYPPLVLSLIMPRPRLAYLTGIFQEFISLIFAVLTTRVEVWWWIFVRNAVKCGEKKIIFTAFFLHLFAVNAVNRDELFFFTAFSVAVNYSFSPLNRLMRWIIFFTASSGEKK